MGFRILVSILFFSVATLSATMVALADRELSVLSCPKLFSAIVQIENTPSKLTKAQYEKHMDELRPYFQGLKSPEFGLYIGAAEPTYSPAVNTIHVPSDISSVVTSKIHSAKYELIMLDHEIGHAIYEKNLGIEKLSFSKLTQRMEAAVVKYNQIYRELSSLHENRIRLSREEFSFREQDIARRAWSIVNEMRDARKAEYILTAYNELFADLTAAIPRGDPSVNANSVRVFVAMKRAETGDLNLFSPFRNRALGREFNPAELEANWRQAQTVETLLGDPHGLFVPIKKQIWDAIAPHLADSDRRGFILQKILSAIRDQALEVFPYPNSSTPKTLDLPQLNADLIERIVKKFGR